MSKLLVICGLTATGKTELAIILAKKFPGEIVSADSRQVYRGMDIGTGKDIGNEKLKIKNEKLQRKIKKETNEKFNIGIYEIDKIPVWMLDVVEPMYRFNVADYLSCAIPVIENIWKRKKLPIIVGGTGLYIKALLDGIETVGVPPDWGLREELSHCSIASLSEQLQKLDPEKLSVMNESDRKNPRRLARAIEIASKNQKSTLRLRSGLMASVPRLRSGLVLSLSKDEIEPSKIKNQKCHRGCGIPSWREKLKNDDILMVGLSAPMEIMRERIKTRLLKWLEMGMVGEVGDLHSHGVSWKRLDEFGLEYRWTGRYLQGKIDYQQMIDGLFKDIVGYAKRQKTWFKKARRVRWFDIGAKNWREKVEKLVGAWYY